VPRLTLIISEEFTINDPYKLEELPDTATVRSVPADSENGKLHAKVLVVKRPDGGLWALVGSANMTWQGLFSNQEACVVLESWTTADRTAIETITDWFDSLLNTARSPDLEAAKTIPISPRTKAGVYKNNGSDYALLGLEMHVWLLR
jgi:HKD family nuclease